VGELFILCWRGFFIALEIVESGRKCDMTERLIFQVLRPRVFAIIIVAIFFAGLSCGCQKSGEIPSGEQNTQSPADRTISIDSNLYEVGERVKDYREKLRRIYPDDDMLKKLRADSSALISAEAFCKKMPEDENQRERLAKISKLRPAVEVLTREVYAANLKRRALDKGHNIEIKATGKDRSILVYSQGLMSKAVAYRLHRESAIMKDAPKIGFRKVVFKSESGDVMTYNLK
jgi:hypothetical protein